MKMNGVRKVVNIESVINSTAHDHCDSAYSPSRGVLLSTRVALKFNLEFELTGIGA